jgi:hypothetical protein
VELPLGTVLWNASAGGDGDVSINWSSSPNLPAGGGDVSFATPSQATINHSNGIDNSVASITFDANDSLTFFAGNLAVADPSSVDRTLTLIRRTPALNGDTAIGTLSGVGTVAAAGQATFAPLFTILQQAAGKRFASSSHLRGEPPCR